MDVKTFLEGFNSKKSVNSSSGLNVQLRGNRKLLPPEGLAEVISAFDVYTDEREACNKIRLTCQVNPICSNVLFNRITEIVRDEGSDNVSVVNYGTAGLPETELFDEVVYKPKSMEFWAGGTMNYQSSDLRLMNKSVEEPINDNVDRRPIRSEDLVSTSRAIDGHPTNAIRDTQLSRVQSDGDHFVYHCGLDIFNNHLIRSNTFKTICKLSDGTNHTIDGYTAFNTIADLMRDVKGDKVIEKLCFPVSAGVQDHTKFIALHTYLYENLLTFEQSKKERLVKKYNGWLGFNNKSKIKTYDDFQNDKDLKIERPIMYMQGGDFVDMYPGRDLYSFVPKFNHFRNRIEKNWNYCITYPSSSTTAGFDDILEFDGSLRALYFDETRRSDNGTRMLVIYSKAKHGLSQGDYVNIYRNNVDTDGNMVSTKILDNAEVENVVDDFIFTVFSQDVEISNQWVHLTEEELRSQEIEIGGVKYYMDSSRKFYRDDEFNKYYIINNSYVNIDIDAQRLSYKKVVNDIECDYYVRIFSRLPNFKNSSGDTSNEYEIYRERTGEEDTRSLVEIYQQPEYDFESHVSRLAFSKNIYTDEVGEIVFTDDIDLSYLKDNLGRPLSELYLTIVKNNKGYREWYGINRDIDIADPIVEYSHCFGKITCGFEMSDESTYDSGSNNIKKINNIDGLDVGYDIDRINGIGRNYRDGKNVEHEIGIEEIWFDSDTRFYGDLCYYDNYNAIERVIQPILHRFNTAQRECMNSSSHKNYSYFLYDEIAQDDYDKNSFSIKSDLSEKCNDKKEGYYYIPHYKIPIRSFDILRSTLPDFLTMRSLVNNGEHTRITTLEHHYLSPGDKSMIYDMENDKYYYCNTVETVNPNVYLCDICTEDGKPTTDIDGDRISDFRLFKIDNLDIPSYARILKDGTCRFIWRDILNNGFNKSDDSIEEYPFTNGAFYINRRVDLFLRRQDPHRMYGLYAEDDVEGITPPPDDENNYVKEENIEC